MTPQWQGNRHYMSWRAPDGRLFIIKPTADRSPSYNVRADGVVVKRTETVRQAKDYVRRLYDESNDNAR